MPRSVDQILGPAERDLPRSHAVGGNRAFHNYYNDYSHISDPNLRRRLALSEVDKIPFGTCHVRAVLVAGAGFLLDSYNIFAINLVTTLLGLVYYSDNGGNGHLPPSISQALKASTSAGIVIGMVLFGWLADTYGRRRMYGIELGIIIFATFSCALAAGSPSVQAPGILIFWRVMMGIGIGGDYPLSSVITAEFAPTRWRGGMVAAVFSMQGFGQLMAAVVALITTFAFQDSYRGIGPEGVCNDACKAAADRSWRIIVGVGALPACLAMYYRVTIPETPRYTFDVQHDVDRAGADIRSYVYKTEQNDTPTDNHNLSSAALHIPKASWADASAYFRKPENLRAIIGTTLSWFFLDLAFYGLGLNSDVVLHAIGYSTGSSLYHKLRNQALGIIILTCAGSLPGYWTSILTVDTVGRKPLQVFGFLLLTAVFCILGFALHSLNEASLLALYIVGQFLFNAGPNTTTFIVSGECFPTRYRATAHGVSAAMGKIGAILAQGISIPLLNRGKSPECHGNQCSPLLNRLLQLFALFMLLGTLVSLLIPETKGVTLEELSGEPHTSYNDGCNGSVRFRSSKWRLWDLFGGGQPAGFSYPRSKWGKFSAARQSPRLGIMATPDLVAERDGEVRDAKFWRRHRKTRLSSNGTSDIAMTSRATDDAASEETAYAQSAPQAPSWGAGWGRIDRGGPAPTANTSQLQDVGSLLRPA